MWGNEMHADWREQLDRAVHGGELSPEEAGQLAESLSDAGNRREAVRWFQFDAAARACFDPLEATRCHRSRERLLAKTALRARTQALGGPVRRRVYRYSATALAVAVLVLIGGTLRLLRAPAEVSPEIRGDYRVVAADGQPRSEPPRRGDRIVAQKGGTRLDLGGYVKLSLDPGTEIVLQGAPAHEAVQLDYGRLVSHVTPGQGTYQVHTPLGLLEVKGTEFETVVDYSRVEEEELMSGTWRHSVVVSVAVLSGLVAFHMGDAAGTLGPGQSQVFAAEEEGRGEREAVRELPEGLRGFKGMLQGRIVAKNDDEGTFNLKITKVLRQWAESKAENAQSAVGVIVRFDIAKTRLAEQHQRALRELRVGAMVEVEGFHQEEGRLSVMEVLKGISVRREGNRREGDRPDAERREGDRREGDRPDVERREGDRPDAERREGNRREGERREGERREGDRREQRTEGKVVAVEGLEVTLQTGDGKIAFRAGGDNQLAALEVEQLRPGDEVAIRWVGEGQKRFVRDVEGRGTLVGKLVAMGETWIEVKPEEGDPVRIRPRWIGGNPSEGGGLDKEILQRIAQLQAGAPVTVVWEMPEGKRIIEIRQEKSEQ